GQGDGNLVAIGKFPPPPSYSAGNSSRGGSMKDLTDGKIYHTITYGINLMGAHASQINPEERWKIVMFVHKLQGQTLAIASADSVKANI
ncbi:MAG: c-type cytochrome, partial [Bacteroidota bacterium]